MKSLISALVSGASPLVAARELSDLIDMPSSDETARSVTLRKTTKQKAVIGET
jgi:hypothetical protein